MRRKCPLRKDQSSCGEFRGEPALATKCRQWAGSRHSWRKKHEPQRSPAANNQILANAIPGCADIPRTIVSRTAFPMCSPVTSTASVRSGSALSEVPTSPPVGVNRTPKYCAHNDFSWCNQQPESTALSLSRSPWTRPEFGIACSTADAVDFPNPHTEIQGYRSSQSSSRGPHQHERQERTATYPSMT
jgi:hypothetical protein